MRGSRRGLSSTHTGISLASSLGNKETDSERWEDRGGSAGPSPPGLGTKVCGGLVSRPEGTDGTSSQQRMVRYLSVTALRYSTKVRPSKARVSAPPADFSTSPVRQAGEGGPRGLWARPASTPYPVPGSPFSQCGPENPPGHRHT